VSELSSSFAVLAAGGGPDHCLEETMKLTKHGLLAAVAATALVAGAGAFAQQSPSAPSGSGTQSGSQMEKQDTKQVPGGKTQAQQPAPGGAEKKEMQGQTQQKTDAQPRGQAQEKDMKKEPGTAQQQQPGAKQQPGQAQQPGGQKGEGTAQKDQPGGQKAAQDKSDAKSDAKSVQLTSEQRTKISTTIKQQTNLKRVSRSEVNFTINVGAVVPRTVNLVVLPAPIIAIVPQFRGYLYIVVDDQLLIIHPTTYEIVMVLPA
jgi:hypothetical protein